MVAVDAHMVGERETGNETYVVNLLRGLADLEPRDQYAALTPRPQRLAAALTLPDNVRPVRVWPAPSLLRIPVGIPMTARRLHADVLHMTTYITPPLAPCPVVVTVHDLSYLEYPEAFSPRVRFLLRTLVAGSIRRAAAVIAVSEFTAKDLVRRYQVPWEKITITPLGVPPEFMLDDEPPGGDLPAGVVAPYVLAVGNLEPRKNLGRLLEAFAVLVHQRGFAGQLVLVGKGAAAAAQITRTAETLTLHNRVVLTGFVATDSLRRLYRQASVFVYPSLYEGFGLPPVEAMASGCPVVASNSSAMPETLGDAALLVDPLSVPALAAAMASVIDRPTLAADLRERGRRRVATMSWRRTAELTRSAYARAAGRQGVAGKPS